MSSTKFNFLRPQGLSLRLLSAIILCSTIFTLLATSIQLFIDFRKDVTGIHDRIKIVEDTYLDTLAASAFALDTPQLKLQLQGILKLPDIEYLELIEIEKGTKRVLGIEGNPNTPKDIFHEFKLPYPPIDNTTAFLRITASLDGIYDKLWDKLFIILISNTIKTFTSSFFIFIIIQQIVIRHLRTITDFAESPEAQNTGNKLQLQRAKKETSDDLDKLTDSINTMRHRLITDSEEIQRIYSIMEVTTDLVATATPDGNILYINQAGQEMLGATSYDDIIGTHISTYYPENEFAIIHDTALPHAVEHGIWNGNTQIKQADGRIISVSEIIMSHKNDDGEVDYFSTVIRDTSEQKLIEQRLRQSEKMDSIGQLAGGIAHDFNNMLGGIMGAADLLRTVVDSENGIRYIELITQSSERAADLTHKM
ncbi:MAG: PAS domain S-box protein, partial [Planctomycetes bacterium]|nr:PAS domain S-box protein [Planctomycetota bacterium]